MRPFVSMTSEDIAPVYIRSNARDNGDALLPRDMHSRRVLVSGLKGVAYVNEARQHGAIVTNEHRCASRLTGGAGSVCFCPASPDVGGLAPGCFHDVVCSGGTHCVAHTEMAVESHIRLVRERFIVLGLPPPVHASRGRVRGRVYPADTAAGRLLDALTERPGVFARVELLPLNGQGTFAAVAHKRRIGHLLMIAGPSAAGKSTLIRYLRAGNLRRRRITPLPTLHPLSRRRRSLGEAASQVTTRLEITDAAAWGAPVGVKRLGHMNDPVCERLLVHYDLLGLRHSARARSARDLLRNAKRVSALTLWTPPERLRRQHQSIGRRARRWLRGKWHCALPPSHRDPHDLLAYYRAYFDLIRQHADQHYIVEIDDTVQFYTEAQWEKRVAEAYRLP